LRQSFEAEIKEQKEAPGWKLAPFDVTSTYWVDDPDKLKALLADPDWENNVIASEKPWIDTERAECQVGFETTFIENGEIVNVKSCKYYSILYPKLGITLLFWL
jgi:hypothetical protein